MLGNIQRRAVPRRAGQAQSPALGHLEQVPSLISSGLIGKANVLVGEQPCTRLLLAAGVSKLLGSCCRRKADEKPLHAGDRMLTLQTPLLSGEALKERP